MPEGRKLPQSQRQEAPTTTNVNNKEQCNWRWRLVHSLRTPVDQSRWRCGRLTVVVECAWSVEAPSTTQCLSEDDKEDLKLANLRNYADIGNARYCIGSIFEEMHPLHVLQLAASRKSNTTRPKFEVAEMFANALRVTSGVSN